MSWTITAVQTGTGFGTWTLTTTTRIPYNRPDDEAVVTANSTGKGNGTGKCMGKGKGTGNRRGNAKRTGKGTNKRKSADNPTATGKYPKGSASTHIPKREVSWVTELVDDNSVVTEGPGVDDNSVVTEVPESDVEWEDRGRKTDELAKKRDMCTAAGRRQFLTEVHKKPKT